MLPAAVAGIMVFAIASASETSLLPGTQSPVLVAASARRSVPPVEEASGWQPAQSTSYRAPEAVPPLPGWPMDTQPVGEVATSVGEPPITGRMR